MDRRIYIPDDTVFDQLNATKAWLLGLLASDGCIRKDGSGFSLSQSGIAGLPLIWEARRILRFRGKTLTTDTSAQPAHSIHITSRPIVNALAKYGIVHRKTLQFSFPSALPREFIPAFMRGYIDGDGCVGVYDNGKGCHYMSISLVGTHDFVLSAAKECPIGARLHHIKRCKDCWDMRWNGKLAMAAGEWIYKKDDAVFESKKARRFNKYIETRRIYDARHSEVLPRRRNTGQFAVGFRNQGTQAPGVSALIAAKVRSSR